MKFGKYLQKRQLELPEYAASFVNYKALKKLIKQLSATPTLLAQNAPLPPTEVLDARASLQANKATFFFRLERELEKVNAFYLQKEAELQLRLRTLLDKKRVMQSRAALASKTSASFITLEEGFQQFGSDLNKLQQFVEINATAFSKILKKWDKTSKSKTKELYLSRAVEVQPCFNRDVISDLSDQATTSLLELGAWAEGEKVQYDSSRPTDHTVSGQSVGTDESDTDSQLLQATNAGNPTLLHEWIVRLKGAPDAGGRFTRAFLSAISDASPEALTLLLDTECVDIQAEDEINERNCLHEAAICGKVFVLELGLQKGVSAERVDVYGRIPLHYACIHGHVEMVDMLLAQDMQTINALDHDNFTPLIHAIVRLQVECVKQLLSHKARIEPEGDSDHVPLNLACQHGSSAITEVLLEQGAQIIPDAEGLFPQHLVARTGNVPETLLLLERYGANLDQRDKLYQWTPLFHAASEGWVECIKVLLSRGTDPSILDEKKLSAMYYATWEGYLGCMKLLNTTALSPPSIRPSLGIQRPGLLTTAPGPLSADRDGIPDLALPPPIIPLRRYGHNFLDSKTFIQISFEEVNSSAIVFYHSSKYPAARLTISSKLSDLIPRNIMLPIQEENKIISFQVDSLDNFSVDLDIFSTFGSKVIAKTVALPNIFSAIESSAGHACLPLFDPRLRAIGQISFRFQVIKAFHGIPLEITQFATYWKATSQFESQPSTAALITGSSLSGEYVRLFVQLTRDGVPILYPFWCISHHDVEFPIGRLTWEQVKQIKHPEAGWREEILRRLQTETLENVVAIHRMLASFILPLRDVLAALPTSINLELHVLYPNAVQERTLAVGSTLDVNSFADAMLQDVFQHARQTRARSPDEMRGIVFTSYNSAVCTALNWKQPNYPVLLCNNLGAVMPSDPESGDEEGAEDTPKYTSSGHKSFSIKEAVRIAQSNNFMGLMCTSRLLTMVPTLIESIKVAGLVLVTDMSTGIAASSARERGYKMPDGVDGMMKVNGVLRFNETIDM